MQELSFEHQDAEFEFNETILNTLPYRDNLITQVVSKIKSQKLVSLRSDTLGTLFEELIREEERKNLGQFYTPQEIVQYIIDYLNIGPNSKILDPTCGCGVFLVTAYNFLKKQNNNALNNIYGVDLNESATKITRINLWLRENRTSGTLNILENNIRVGNSIVEDRHIDHKAFDWKKNFAEIVNNGGFDFIIGNPPYLTLKNGRDYNIRESNFSTIANGTTNAASLVVAKSFELIKEGGIMAFVLPKTLLRVNSYYNLRTFMLENAKILHIYDLGTCFNGVRGEQIILFMQKSKNNGEISKNKVLIKVFDDLCKPLKEQKAFTISQNVFKKYNNFLMFEDKKYYRLVEKISNEGERLENLANIFRGLAISPDSKAIERTNNKNSSSIIKGNDISKFSYTMTYFIKNDELAKEASKLSQFKHEKIILQNIFSSESGLIAAIDTNGCLTFDTVTSIVLNDGRINKKYLLGLLNSKLINFYLNYAIYNKSKLTMHTDKVYIGQLPIKSASQKRQEAIIELVSRIKKANNKKVLLSQLDSLVYDIYGINKPEQNLIENALKKIMSAKSLW